MNFKIIVLLAVVNHVVIAVTLWPICLWDTLRARIGSAVLLFSLVALILRGLSHACDEGTPPLFVIVAGALLTAAAPLLATRRRWLIPILVCASFTSSVLSALLLMDVYHGKDYTGNPAYSSGRFWHTPLTGIYPRSALR